MKKIFLYMLLILLTINLLNIEVYGRDRDTVTIPIYLLAVNKNDQGVVIKVMLEITYPGTGSIKVETENGYMGSDTYASIKYSTILASILTGVNYRLYDYKYILPKNIRLEGPSATLNFLLTLLSFYMNNTIDEKIGVTGLVSPNGLVGLVEGVDKKYSAGISYGLDKIIGPYIKDMIGEPKYFAVSDIFQAYQFYTGDTLFHINMSMDRKYLSKVYGRMEEAFKHSYIELHNRVDNIINTVKNTSMNLDLNNTAGYKYYLLANKYAEKDKWYTASSYCFRAYIDLYTRYLEKLVQINYIRAEHEINKLALETFNLTKTFINNLDNLLDNGESIWNIDVFISSYYRYAMSLELYKEYMSIADINRKIKDIVLANARILTAYHWLRLLSLNNTSHIYSREYFINVNKYFKELLTGIIDYLSSLNITRSKEYFRLISSFKGDPYMVYLNYTLLYIEINDVLTYYTSSIFNYNDNPDFLENINNTVYEITLYLYNHSKATPPSIHTTWELVRIYSVENETKDILNSLTVDDLSHLIPLLLIIHTARMNRQIPNLFTITVTKTLATPIDLEILVGIIVLTTGSFIIGYLLGKTSSKTPYSREESYVYQLVSEKDKYYREPGNHSQAPGEASDNREQPLDDK